MSNSEVAEIGLLIKSLQKKHEEKNKSTQNNEKRKNIKGGLQRSRQKRASKKKNKITYSNIYKQAIFAEILRGK